MCGEKDIDDILNMKVIGYHVILDIRASKIDTKWNFFKVQMRH